MSYLIPTWELVVESKRVHRTHTAEALLAVALSAGLARTRNELDR